MQSTETLTIDEPEFAFTPEAERMMRKLHTDHMAELGMNHEEYSAFLKTPKGRLSIMYRPFPAEPTKEKSVPRQEAEKLLSKCGLDWDSLTPEQYKLIGLFMGTVSIRHSSGLPFETTISHFAQQFTNTLLDRRHEERA